MSLDAFENALPENTEGTHEVSIKPKTYDFLRKMLDEADDLQLDREKAVDQLAKSFESLGLPEHMLQEFDELKKEANQTPVTADEIIYLGLIYVKMVFHFKDDENVSVSALKDAVDFFLKNH